MLATVFGRATGTESGDKLRVTLRVDQYQMKSGTIRTYEIEKVLERDGKQPNSLRFLLIHTIMASSALVIETPQTV